MSSIKIEGTPKTPTVHFDDTTGLLELRGRSIPENSIEFYKPLIDWIDRYSRTAQTKTSMRVQLAPTDRSGLAHPLRQAGD